MLSRQILYPHKWKREEVVIYPGLCAFLSSSYSPNLTKSAKLWQQEGVCISFKRTGGQEAHKDNGMFEMVFYEKTMTGYKTKGQTNLEKVTQYGLRQTVFFLLRLVSLFHGRVVGMCRPATKITKYQKINQTALNPWQSSHSSLNKLPLRCQTHYGY